MTKQKKEKKQNEEGENKVFDILEIEKSITNLQGLGMCLKDVAFRLPYSMAKEYLLAEMSKVIKLKTAHDFYYLDNKISWMINMAGRYGLDGEVLELLEEIAIETKKIVDCIESEESSKEA